MTADGYLTVQQAADLAGLSTKTILRHIQRGELKAFRVGGRYRLREGDVRAWVEADPVEPVEPSVWRSRERLRVVDRGGFADSMSVYREAKG